MAVVPRLRQTASDFSEGTRDLLQTLLLPDDSSEALRYSGEGNGTKTAAQILKQEFELSWDSTGGGIGTQLPSDEVQWFTFRNSVRSVVYMKRGVTTYNYYIKNENGADFTYSGGIKKLVSATPAAGDGGIPHGPYMYAAEDAGDLGHWVDNDGSGSQGIVVSSTVALPTTCWIDFYFHDGKQWVLYVHTVCDGTALGYSAQAPAGGAYMFAAVGGPAAPAGAPFTIDVTVNASGAGPFACWSHNPVPNMAELQTQALGMRVLGAIGWFRNESSEEFANGKILANTMAKAFPWSNIASGTNQVGQTVDYFSGFAKLGHYAFLTPDDGDDFTMENDISLDSRRFNISNQKVTFPLRDRSPYITGSCACNNTARDFSLITWHFVEYETTSKLVERRFSSYSEDQWRAAIEIAKRIPHHYENRFHFDKIMEGIGRYGAPITNMVAEVLSGFPGTAFVGNILKGEGIRKGFAQIEHAAKRHKR